MAKIAFPPVPSSPHPSDYCPLTATAKANAKVFPPSSAHRLLLTEPVCSWLLAVGPIYIPESPVPSTANAIAKAKVSANPHPHPRAFGTANAKAEVFPNPNPHPNPLPGIATTSLSAPAPLPSSP